MPYISGIALFAVMVCVLGVIATAVRAKWDMTPKALVFPCRLTVNGPSGPRKYRVTILTSIRDYVEAEQAAHGHLESIIAGRRDEFGEDFDLKWLKARWLTPNSLRDESDEVVNLLARLRKSSQEKAVSSVERIELLESPRELKPEGIPSRDARVA